MEARGREGIVHPQVVGIAIDAEEAELSSFGVGEPELRGEGGSFREKDRHGKRESRLHCVQRITAPSLAISGEARRHVNTRGASGEEPREGSLPVIVEKELRHRGEELRHRGDASREGGAEELREESGILFREEEPVAMPGELLSAVKTKSEGEPKLASLPVGEASRPKEAKKEGVAISEEGESAASPAGCDG
jgi:hypothetical protein